MHLRRGRFSMSGTNTSTETSDQIKIVLATLIALSTILGALFTWRASVASGGASGADEAGLNAFTNSLAVRNLTQASAYQHLQGYIRYLSERAVSESLSAEASRTFDEFIQNNGEFADLEA